MLVKYTYPVKSTLRVAERWPTNVAKFRVEFGEENGLANSISVQLAVPSTARLPQVHETNDPKVPLHINFGDTGVHDDVTQFLITTQGLLSLFAKFEIDFSGNQVEWIPENDEEKSQLHVFSHSIKRERPFADSSPRMTFDLVVRALLAAPHASDYEVPLSFVRRGMQDILEDRCIEAFYNFFFFLETLFAPGYSNPKVVEGKFLQSQILRDALITARQELDPDQHREARSLKSLLQKTDEELIRYLVQTRGHLHHHALSRPGVWHPEKPDRYLSEAIIVQKMAHVIVMSKALSIMFAPERSEELIQNSKEVGAEIAVRAEVIELHHGRPTPLRPIELVFPGLKPHYALINAAHQELRKTLATERPIVRPHSFKLLSANQTQLYATYERLQATSSGPANGEVNSKST